MKNRTPLSENELSALLQNHPHWQLHQSKLQRKIKFADFSTAWAFMSRVALLAEQLEHHPDWSNAYNQVDIQLFTHDKNALTGLDAAMLEGIDALLSDFKVL